MLDIASMAIKALGVRVGFLHTEIKLTPDGPRIIEVNGRLGGSVAEMAKACHGHRSLRAGPSGWRWASRWSSTTWFAPIESATS